MPASVVTIIKARRGTDAAKKQAGHERLEGLAGDDLGGERRDQVRSPTRRSGGDVAAVDHVDGPGAIARGIAVEESEEQTGQQSAYDPETGEINWDCPCLGGMAHGPCGEQFKLAFSCFVYSEAEPKGIDCVDKFKAMQDCFREHPDVYKDEIEDDEAANAQFEKEEANAKSNGLNDAAQEAVEESSGGKEGASA